MIGLDSTVLIDIYRGEKKVEKFLDNQFVLTRLNYFEIIAELNQQDKHHEQEIYLFEDLFNSIPLF